MKTPLLAVSIILNFVLLAVVGFNLLKPQPKEDMQPQPSFAPEQVKAMECYDISSAYIRREPIANDKLQKRREEIASKILELCNLNYKDDKAYKQAF